MTRSEIMEKLNKNEYKITHAEGCKCVFTLSAGDDKIIEDVDSGECWESNMLTVDDTPVAEWVRYEIPTTYQPYINIVDIPEHILDELRTFDKKRKHPYAHEKIRVRCLRYWLSALARLGWIFYRHNPIGFANKYELLLVSPDANTDTLKEKKLTEITAEQFADYYLYNGDNHTVVW